MAPKYKLTYFNSKGIIEPLRYIFAYKNVDYEDCRISKDDWPSIKSEQPFGKLPVLEFEGKVLSESVAITRYIAREYGLEGKDNLESAKIDMLIDALKDCSGRRKFMFEEDPVKKEEIRRQYYADNAVLFNRFEIILKENGGSYFVGDTLTWADFGIAYCLYEIRGDHACALDHCPTLATYVDEFHEIPQIKDWIKKRPKS